MEAHDVDTALGILGADFEAYALARATGRAWVPTRTRGRGTKKLEHYSTCAHKTEEGMGAAPCAVVKEQKLCRRVEELARKYLLRGRDVAVNEAPSLWPSVREEVNKSHPDLHQGQEDIPAVQDIIQLGVRLRAKTQDMRDAVVAQRQEALRQWTMQDWKTGTKKRHIRTPAR